MKKMIRIALTGIAITAAAGAYHKVSAAHLRKLWLVVCTAIFIMIAASCGLEVGVTSTPEVTGTPEVTVSPAVTDIPNASDPAEFVRARYMRWLSGGLALSMDVISAEVDELETERAREAFKGSFLAKRHNWTEEYIDNNLVAVKLCYDCELDRDKTSMKDGSLEGYVYLILEKASGDWKIITREIKARDGSDYIDETDPAEVVRTEYLLWIEDVYTISIDVISAEVDEAESERIKSNYMGSELAESRGWSDEYIEDNLIVVRIRYNCELDHNKTPMRDGLLEGFVYLMRDIDSGIWTILDRTSPHDVIE